MCIKAHLAHWKSEKLQKHHLFLNFFTLLRKKQNKFFMSSTGKRQKAKRKNVRLIIKTAEINEKPKQQRSKFQTN